MKLRLKENTGRESASGDDRVVTLFSQNSGRIKVILKKKNTQKTKTKLMHWLSLTDTEAVRENSGDTVWIHHIYPRQSDSIMCNGICAKSEIWHWQMVLVLMKCEVWNIVKLHNRARLWFLRRRDGTWPTESMNCLNTWSNFSLLWKFNKNPIHTQHWNQRFEKHLNGDKKK